MDDLSLPLEDMLLLDDVVIFELPTHEDADAFSERFASRWNCWSDVDGEGSLFTVLLDEDSDLAQLLREAELLVGELGLDAIRFSLDGRIYVLFAHLVGTMNDLAA